MEYCSYKYLQLTQCSEKVINLLFSGKLDNCTSGQVGRIIYWKGQKGLYGIIKSDFAFSEDDNISGYQLETVTISFYQEIFKFISEYPGYQLVRIWNYVPILLKDMDQSAPDIEGYRCFNSGRYKAFKEQYGPDMEDWQIPAATGVGSKNESLTIEFFASDAPCIFFENKVQTPAYQYSEKYGKLPPVFSRGVVCSLENKTLFISSGTASVVKEDNLYDGDIHGQIRQIFENLRVLTSRENFLSYGLDLSLSPDDMILLIVYYKHKTDREFIESEVRKTVPSNCAVVYVNTDICRKQLVIEMESFYQITKIEF